MIFDDLQKQMDQLKQGLQSSPESAKKLVNSMILGLNGLRAGLGVIDAEDILIDLELLFNLVQWTFNRKKTKEQIAKWLQQQGLQQCPICYKWSKELHEIKTDLRYLWSTWPKGMNDDHGDLKKVCGWCHDYITDQLPPAPDGDDSDLAYDIWVENQPDYPDYREDYY